MFNLKGKHCPRKPGSVLRLSFIYSASRPTDQAFYPPLHAAVSASGGRHDIRAGRPRAMVYANLQLPAGTARRSPDARWSLTPPSHPYLSEAVVFFCPCRPSPAASAFGSGIPFAARTFLPQRPFPIPPRGNRRAAAGDRPEHCFPDCKSKYFFSKRTPFRAKKRCPRLFASSPAPFKCCAYAFFNATFMPFISNT